MPRQSLSFYTVLATNMNQSTGFEYYAWAWLLTEICVFTADLY